jgi:hypothetical protein
VQWRGVIQVLFFFAKHTGTVNLFVFSSWDIIPHCQPENGEVLACLESLKATTLEIWCFETDCSYKPLATEY